MRAASWRPVMNSSTSAILSRGRFRTTGHSFSSGLAAQDKGGDVAAAAIELHVVLGNTPLDFVKAFQEWDGRQLMKIAAAQVHAGDAKCALRWSRAMPLPQQRAWALVGVAQGLIESSSTTAEPQARSPAGIATAARYRIAVLHGGVVQTLLCLGRRQEFQQAATGESTSRKLRCR